MITAAQIRSDPRRFAKLRLAEPKAEVSFRFGGSRPKGIQPSRLTPFTAFLLTLPFDEHVSCSIFTNLNSFDSESPYFVFTAAGMAHDETSHLVEACWHAPETKVESLALPLVLPALDFEVEGEDHDPALIEDRLPDPDYCFDHHKLGGFPFFYQAGEGVIEAVQALISDGFHHQFQLAFPGPDDADINCNWPFGEYVFHMFSRPLNDSWESIFVWS